MIVAETEWYLITVDNKHGIKLMKEMDDWLKQPMKERNTYLFDEIKDGVVCFKILLPLFTVNSIARDMVLGKDKEALVNLYHTIISHSSYASSSYFFILPKNLCSTLLK